MRGFISVASAILATASTALAYLSYFNIGEEFEMIEILFVLPSVLSGYGAYRLLSEL